MKNFEKYSAYYDLLYADKDYQAEALYVQGLIKAVFPTAKTILNLGCGTGGHDFALEKMGYEVTGVDLSVEMIAIANEKKLKNGSKVSFLNGDIRHFVTEKRFDVVVSLFHVMSYQTSNVDVLDSLETAQRHLVAGGLLVFDYWSGVGVLTDPPTERAKLLENDQILVERVAQPAINHAQNVVNVHYNIKITDKTSRKTQILAEKHPMRYFFEPELDLFCQIKGLKPLSAFQWLTDEIPQKNWFNVRIAQK